MHPAIDPVIFAELEQLADGDAEFFQDLFGTFDEQAELLFASARAAANAGRSREFLSAVHALNGSSRNVGAMEFARICTAIEQGKAPVSSLAGMLELMEEPLHVARLALRELLRPMAVEG
jgi:HPt (histidine-containing phosphotransfer) domain-containing protein